MDSVGLTKLHSSRRVPRLTIRRLKFTGTKTIGEDQFPINYDQGFRSGVNAVVIEDNLVGKSSILKTIKFALTGNDDEYDSEVRRWITDIWLQFSLDERRFTILFAIREDGLHCKLATGDYECQIDDVSIASDGFYRLGKIESQQAIESFFIAEFGLASLGWNRAQPGGTGESMQVWASWLTYFQALRILDDNHAYLLCKPEYVNQDQLLFSAFLGLHLSESLNKLSMEAAAAKKSKEFLETQLDDMRSNREEMHNRRLEIRSQLSELDAQLSRRLDAMTGGGLDARLIQSQNDFMEASSEVTGLEEQLSSLTTQMQQSVATARRFREQIDLTRELSGLDVKICPNCIREIDSDALKREKATHECRLCVRPVPKADEDEEATLKARAESFDVRADELKQRINRLNSQLADARHRGTELKSLAETLRTSIRDGLAKGLPTKEENDRKANLHEEIGGLNHRISELDQQLKSSTASVNNERKAKIVEKLTEVIKKEADVRNALIQARLNEMVIEVTKALRADRISGVKCYPTGVVKLTKNGEVVPYSSIMNPGERYRGEVGVVFGDHASRLRSRNRSASRSSTAGSARDCGDGSF